MIRGSQASPYIPLQTEVPADGGASMREKDPSARYTREPQALSREYREYLEPRTTSPDDVELSEKEELKRTNGGSSMKLGIDGDAHYQVPRASSKPSDYVNQDSARATPTENAPMIPKPPQINQDDYLAPVNDTREAEVTKAEAPADNDGYLPPQNLAVDIDDATANYTNL